MSSFWIRYYLTTQYNPPRPNDHESHLKGFHKLIMHAKYFKFKGKVFPQTGRPETRCPRIRRKNGSIIKRIDCKFAYFNVNFIKEHVAK